jgi:hypothetical protein
MDRTESKDVQQERNIQMRIAITIFAAAAALLPVAAFANSNVDLDTYVHGQQTAVLAAGLSDQGIRAERIEEWGNSIRVDAVDANGSHYVVLVDASSLQPLNGSDTFIR